MVNAPRRVPLADLRLTRAFSHEIRIQILLNFVALGDGAMLTPKSFTDAHQSTLGARLEVVSYHFRTLHRLGLVELVNRRAVRGSISHTYALASKHADAIEQRLTTPARRRGGETLVLTRDVALDGPALIELRTMIPTLVERLASETTTRGATAPQITVALVATHEVRP